MRLLEGFISKGLKHLVLCPGSRSSPIALAAGWLSGQGKLNLETSIDERSAAFEALGVSTALGTASLVVTTSGSAVANLLPAAVEADRSCHPLLLLSADRPLRLKNCGANQTVNQEDFLKPVCRCINEGPLDGIHLFNANELSSFSDNAWLNAHDFPGPVHINLSIEEPLVPSLKEQEEVWEGWIPRDFYKSNNLKITRKLINNITLNEQDINYLDPSIPGFVVAGPWRGSPNKLREFNCALRKWISISSWPILADPLSGVSSDQVGLIKNWEILLPNGLPLPKGKIQVLRLGSMPSSRNLYDWLSSLQGKQLLITEGESRNLDSIGNALQYSEGFSSWLNYYLKNNNIIQSTSNTCINLIKQIWHSNDNIANSFLEVKFPLNGFFSEPSLAYWLSKLIPRDISIMLASSSPVRDWLSFSGSECLQRRCYGFRGASGIDGTLSLAMGLSMFLNPFVLITGDLALLHDSNGWLFSKNNKRKLVVILIDNSGGGIFRQLYLDTINTEMIDELFSMPQIVDQCKLAEAHDVPCRDVSSIEDLSDALEWSLSKSETVLLRVITNSSKDRKLRNNLRSELEINIQSHYE